MDRKELDNLLPFVLKRDNVARYEDGVVYIGDRRKYPFEKEFVRCEDVEDVARAIEDMVTQGGGPWVAAVFAMAMAAHKVEGKALDESLEYLRNAKTRLVNTRPTNTAMARRLEEALLTAEKAGTNGESMQRAIINWMEAIRDKVWDLIWTRLLP